MSRRQRRLVLIGGALAVLGIAAALVLNALKESIVFFHSPTEVVEKHLEPGARLRIGGLVKVGSLQHEGAFAVRFEVTDGHAGVPVAYTGALPDLFREGQGVVAEGRLGADGLFKADTILAKHDERYMPKEVADALKRQGRWNEGAPDAASAGSASMPAR
jgi:cytochrome c-type biogenesis protein CcmE